ncbi:hypothetical protein KGM_202763 [Danaus plexippus plexippus]|uniref:Uncharacterized protein n=1 Tax=Danaus plexippus plexippus TaxID=278856 RepID=A0A212F1Z4_DANPL|nr:hypothetical protein KGM_202763 [Danaus plexippus plexippus]
MLKFLTHKLRTHSLNEENVTEKVEERDSGTESDDEAERADTGEYCADVIMKWNDVTDIKAEQSYCRDVEQQENVREQAYLNTNTTLPPSLSDWNLPPLFGRLQK